ncbi:MAG: hypothetical protein ACWGSD_05510 [Thermodesulfobacteriota bacterium]
MQTKGNVLRNQMAPSPAHVWEAVRGLAKSFLRRDAIVDAALALIALDSVGFVLFSLHRALGNYTVTGF